MAGNARQTATESTRHGRRSTGLLALLRRLWPAKASLELHLLTGCSIRHAERLLSENSKATGLSYEMTQALLHSPHGLAVLREIMAGCRESWWLQLELALSDIEYQQRRQALLNQIALENGQAK